MNALRRVSHTEPVPTRRERQIADLLLRVLASYGYTVAAHGDCPSCGTDLAVLVDKAAALGVAA